MRYTIEGFSQTEAIKFRRTETIKRKNPRTGVYEDKEAVVALDCTDLVILRWLVDFWPRMIKVEIGGVQYAWLSYKDAIKDMPLLGVKKAAFALRLKKMVSFGILTHKTVKSNGTFSYYGFGPEYMRLADTDRAREIYEGEQNSVEGVHKILDTPAQNFSDQIDSSTKDSSTKDNPKKERKKPAETYDSIIDSYTENGELRSALVEFVKMRKMMKKPLTNKALSLLLTSKKGLDGLASTDAEKIDIVQQSIMRGWQGFFPLKDIEAKKNTAPHETSSGFNRKIDADYYYQSTGDEEVDKVLGLGKYATSRRRVITSRTGFSTVGSATRRSSARWRWAEGLSSHTACAGARSRKRSAGRRTSAHASACSGWTGCAALASRTQRCASGRSPTTMARIRRRWPL